MNLRWMLKAALVSTCLLLASFPAEESVSGQSPFGEDTPTPEAIKKHVDQAAVHFKAKETDEATTEINSAISELKALLETDLGKATFDELKKNYGRLKKAHELLSKSGGTLEDLPTMPENFSKPKSKKESKKDSKKAEGISFTKQVAPLLAQNCAMCHIQGNKGQVNFANFDALMNSPKGLIVANDPKQSRLFHSIQTKKMPPRRPMNEKDVKLIEQWIAEGANFDGKDKSQPLGAGRGR